MKVVDARARFNARRRAAGPEPFHSDFELVPRRNPDIHVSAPEMEYLIRQTHEAGCHLADVNPNYRGPCTCGSFTEEQILDFIDYCSRAVLAAPNIPEASTQSQLTKAVALSLPYRSTLYHRIEKDSMGLPLKSRVNGKVKTWKRSPEAWELPIKYGLNEQFRIVGGRDPAPPNVFSSPDNWTSDYNVARGGWVTARDITAFMFKSIRHGFGTARLVFRDYEIFVASSRTIARVTRSAIYSHLRPRAR